MLVILVTVYLFKYNGSPKFLQPITLIILSYFLYITLFYLIIYDKESYEMKGKANFTQVAFDLTYKISLGLIDLSSQNYLEPDRECYFSVCILIPLDETRV